MKKRILSMMLCCFMLFGMIVIVSADSTTPDHTRAGCDAVWSESFEGFEAGATDLPSGWKKGDKTDTYVYTANSTTIENMVPHHGEKYLCVYNQSRMVFDEGEYSHTVSVPSSLELPEFQLESNQKYFLTFEVRHLMTGNFARDTIGIYVSAAGKEYERIQYHEIDSKESAEWETVEVDLSAYAGSTVRIKLGYTQEDQFHPSLVFDCFYLWKVDIAAPVANFSMFYYGYQREIAKTAVTQSPYNAGIKWDSGYGNGYFICTDPTSARCSARECPRTAPPSMRPIRSTICAACSMFSIPMTLRNSRKRISILQATARQRICSCIAPTTWDIHIMLSLSFRY